MTNELKTARIDLHCHSWASDRPSLWLMQRLGCPESFTSPEYVRDTAMQRGMNFVTITDHNTDMGVREIQHYDNVILGDEVTTYFPEDIKVHVVCLGFTERQHREIHEVREDIYDLVQYLNEQNIVHYCAHPLHKINGRLTWEHFEKLLLLFKTLEILNGTRLKRFNWVTEQVIANLTESDIMRLAEKHDIAPVGPEPWKKIAVGGTDDHSGLFIGTCYTEIYVEELNKKGVLDGLRKGRTRVCGQSDGCLTLSHQVNSIAYQFLRSKIGRESEELLLILGQIFERNRPIKINSKMRFRRRLKRFFNYFRKPTGYNRNLIEEIREIISSNVALKSLFTEGIMTREEYNRNVFTLASDVLDQMILRLFEKPQLIHYFLIFAPTVLSSYMMTMRNLHGERDLIEKGEKWLGIQKVSKVAWFTDSYNKHDSPSEICQLFLQVARKKNKNLKIVISDPNGIATEGVINLQPVKSIPIPGYEKVTLHVPSILKMLKRIEDEDFDAVIVSTPGPVGILGLICGKLMRLPVYGIYHTDFPRIALHISGDPMFAEMALLLTRMFYRHVDLVFTPTRKLREDMKNLDIPTEKTTILKRWIDPTIFNPHHRNSKYWRREESVKLLYVSRILGERNVNLLIRLYEYLSQRTDQFILCLVGECPDHEEIHRKTFAHSRLILTGAKDGVDLATAYASSDIFLFPRVLDSFRMVILEAAASGLPTVAMSDGSPQELILHDETGFLCRGEEDFFQAVETLVLDGNLREKMGQQAHKRMTTQFSEENVFSNFWETITRFPSELSSSPKFDFEHPQNESNIVHIRKTGSVNLENPFKGKVENE